MSVNFLYESDGTVIAVTEEHATCTLSDHAGRVLAVYPGSGARGVTMREVAYTPPFCRPPGEAWQRIGECTREGMACWVWQRLWALASGGV